MCVCVRVCVCLCARLAWSNHCVCLCFYVHILHTYIHTEKRERETTCSRQIKITSNTKYLLLYGLFALTAVVILGLSTVCEMGLLCYRAMFWWVGSCVISISCAQNWKQLSKFTVILKFKAFRALNIIKFRVGLYIQGYIFYCYFGAHKTSNTYSRLIIYKEIKEVW